MAALHFARKLPTGQSNTVPKIDPQGPESQPTTPTALPIVPSHRASRPPHQLLTPATHGNSNQAHDSGWEALS